MSSLKQEDDILLKLKISSREHSEKLHMGPRRPKTGSGVRFPHPPHFPKSPLSMSTSQPQNNTNNSSNNGGGVLSTNPLMKSPRKKKLILSKSTSQIPPWNNHVMFEIGEKKKEIKPNISPSQQNANPSPRITRFVARRNDGNDGNKGNGNAASYGAVPRKKRKQKQDASQHHHHHHHYNDFTPSRIVTSPPDSGEEPHQLGGGNDDDDEYENDDELISPIGKFGSYTASTPLQLRRFRQDSMISVSTPSPVKIDPLNSNAGWRQSKLVGTPSTTNSTPRRWSATEQGMEDASSHPGSSHKPRRRSFVSTISQESASAQCPPLILSEDTVIVEDRTIQITAIGFKSIPSNIMIPQWEPPFITVDDLLILPADCPKGKLQPAVRADTGERFLISKHGIIGEARKEYFDELELLLKARNSAYILNVRNALLDTTNLKIVSLLEPMEMSLTRLLQLRGPMPEPILSLVMYHVVQAVEYVHDALRQIINAIEPSNFFVSGQGAVKLASLRLAAPCGPNEAEEWRGKLRFMAPERLLKLECSLCSDVWSLGVLAYELATGTPAFNPEHFPDPLAFKAHISSCVMPISPIEFSPDLKTFIEHCLYKQPTKRPAARELKHYWLFKRHASVRHSTLIQWVHGKSEYNVEH